MAPLTAPDMVAPQLMKVNVHALIFRDPNMFVAGEIRNYLVSCREILNDNPKQEKILFYLELEVDVHEFIIPFDNYSQY